MYKEPYSDKLIIKFILSGEQERNMALKYLFNHQTFRKITTEMVTNGGGNKQNVESIFEDCLIQLDRLIRRFQYYEESFSQFFEKQAKLSWCQELQVNETTRNEVLNKLGSDQDLKRQVRAVVTKNSGKIQDAEDCYQSGLLLLNKQLSEGKYKGGAIKGFFYQSCYNLWRNELKKYRTVPLPDEYQNFNKSKEDPSTIMESKRNAELLDKVFNKLGDSCQKILELKYFIIDQLSMSEIAAQMGLKNAQNASNTLSKCRKRLWELLNEYEHPYVWIRST